jgi:hypothetical protein
MTEFRLKSELMESVQYFLILLLSLIFDKELALKTVSFWKRESWIRMNSEILVWM